MRFQSFALFALLPVAAATASACGGGTVVQQSSGTGTGGTGGTTGVTATTTTATSTTTTATSSSGGPDAGAPSTTYPAPFPAPPQAMTLTGPVNASPLLVPVFFSNEDPTSQAGLTSFVATVGATPYWTATTSEYGVGPATSATPIVLTETAPATIDDAAIQTWLVGKLSASDSAWPAPSADTLYVLHYPAGTTITLQGNTSCTGFGGYHNNAMLGQQLVSYAVVPDCPDLGSLQGLKATTAAESHELIEGCTDPYPQDDPAFLYPDEAHFYYLAALGGGEVGDMCAQFPGVFTQFSAPADEVQRTWSNKSIAGGHDPCVPELPGEVYAAAAPVMTDDLSFTVEGQTIAMQGVKIAKGQSKTIEVDLYSEASTGGPFAVEALDYTSAFLGGTAGLTLSFEDTGTNQSKGENGQKLYLTITSVGDGQFAVPGIMPATDAAFVLIGQWGQGMGEQSFYVGIVGN